MRVYVIRHGESETNKAKKWTGWLDVHLTDKGKDDANKAGNFLKGNFYLPLNAARESLCSTLVIMHKKSRRL